MDTVEKWKCVQSAIFAGKKIMDHFDSQYFYNIIVYALNMVTAVSIINII